MCGLILLDKSGDVVDEDDLDALTEDFIGVGRLLFPDDEEKTLEIARMANEGCRNYSVISDRAVGSTFSDVRSALQELGFAFIESVYQKIFECIQVSLKPSEEKST